jgi:septum formation protein
MVAGELITPPATWYGRPVASPHPTSPLVLGSASPRRREILERLRLPFVVVTASADEAVLEGEPIADYLARVVLLKLAGVRAVLDAGLAARARAILVADTSVVDGAAILGKPNDSSEARSMLERLAGRTHEVHTRFALAPADAPAVVHAETVVTRVSFRRLTPFEMDTYAAIGEGMDKAGGYAVQGLAAGFVTRIEGSYTNVVGLPACELVVALSRVG